MCIATPEYPYDYQKSSGNGRGERRRPRYGLLLAILVGALGMGFLGVYIADVVLLSGETAENVHLNGVELGGLSEEEIRTEVAALAEGYGNRSLPLLTPAGTIGATVAELGFALDVEANVAAALAAGQTGASPIAWASSFFGENNLNAVVTWDETVAEQFAAGVEEILVREAASARLEMRDNALEVEPGIAGLRITPSDVRAALQKAAEARTLPDVIVVEASSFPPEITAVQLQPTADHINALTYRGITIHVEDTIRDFLPAEVRGWLRVTPGDPPMIDLDTEYVTEVIETRLENIAVPGDPGRFDIIDGTPVVVDPRPGRRCCAPKAGETVLAALQAGYHEIRLHLTDDPGSEGDLIAQTGIRELTGQFTTRFTPGQSRVTNIRRIAELVQGAIIEPGERWSVNDYVGRRTEAKGFVPGGVIYLGKFQQDVGGGVSQFATTLFNAAFFAGLDFGEYRAHSIYLSRYPYGREATISYPHPDLEIINNTPYSVLLWPTSTESSVTVQVFSTRHMTVEQSNQRIEMQGLCEEVFTERTRTFDDGTSTTDIVKALYQPGEGLNCQGEPFVPPPDCAAGEGAVDTDNDGWVESCRPLCPLPDDAAAGAGAAEGCVPVCSEGTGPDDGVRCVPRCGPEDSDASPGSCFRADQGAPDEGAPDEGTAGSEEQQAPPADEQPGGPDGEADPPDGEAGSDVQPIETE